MRYKILDQEGIHFLTFTIVEWIDLFTRQVYADLFLAGLQFCQQHKNLQVYAYVIMSSHVHLIVQAPENGNLSNIIQSLKSYTARQFLDHIQDYEQAESRRDWLLNHFAFNAKKNRTGSPYQVWQKGNHPFLLSSPKMIRQKLNYIHQNPVEVGMVNLPEHYRYSSAASYENQQGPLTVTLLEDIWDDMGYVG